MVPVITSDANEGFNLIKLWSKRKIIKDKAEAEAKWYYM